MKPVLVMVATVPMSFDTLVSGQPRFLSGEFEVHIVTSEDSERIDRIEKKERVEVHTVALTREITPLKDLKALFALYRLFRRLEADCVYTFTPKAGLLGTIAAFFAGVPTRIHNVVGMPLMEAKGLKRVILEVSEKTSYFFSTSLYCNSFGLREYMAEKLGVEDVEVVWNGSIDGVDTSRFEDTFSAEEKAGIRESLGFGEDDFVMVFVGRIVVDKGLRELLGAFERLESRYENLRLLIVGDFEKGEDPFHLDLKNRIEAAEGIVLTGFVSDVRSYLAISDLFVLPSYREGLPNSLLEAGSMGLPLLASDINGCNEVVIPFENGLLCKKKSVDSLADAIERFLRDKSLYDKVAGRVRSTIMERYDQRVFREKFKKRLLEEIKSGLGSRRGLYPRLIKPSMDRIVAFVMLVTLSPLMLVTAAVLYVFVNRNVMFTQKRPGKNEKPFTLYKFRTMSDERDENGELLPDEERLGSVGRIVRSLSLDELPQLYNVLKGDMSLIGPRPLLMEYLELYDERQRRRHAVKPGITGWAQVNGRNALSWEERFEYDLWYVENLSFGLDMKIVWMTLLKVLKREGVSQKGRATMEKFKGNG